VELRTHIAARKLGDDDDRVWSGDRGGSLDHRWYYKKRFKSVVEELSAAGVLPTSVVETSRGPRTYTARFHDPRHSCVAMLIARGARQYEVMEHLGHTNIQTTINTYGHLSSRVSGCASAARSRNRGRLPGADPSAGPSAR
jgi:integrase